ncbi:hypothetical protein ASPVEDRAFT_84460 [Aspergillus versicolor CBS 583.65]|uniref:NAD-dependent epimerase/dehydratase domain-containing protein n=1 Tax=Aspergillus versicolor CBS 583.65 TaxID=1036611 RepID=A0A1L9PND3_ASPVE|nr:uncharacterized protein ASPVEDRAFT_84460 [Aspergillus versicolor CBS 583.65]OJJ02992.1 hypothetical protein ASPVEDRAFT_84460 [Aspergillus versicolor CBS 583.65]
MGYSRVLVTGATGFIGGSVLTQFLASENPALKDSTVTTIVRKQEHADNLQRHGVSSILFTGLDDTERLRQIASQFDIVVHCATGLHTQSAVALILGLGDSMRESGKQTYYIHTTGTSNLAYGMVSHPDAVIPEFSDTDDVYTEEVRRDADEHYDQRATDIAVVKAAEAAGVKAYLMMPPTVFGTGSGLFKKQSIQIPFTIQHAIDQGYPEYIGDGSGTVGYVHISDLASLYELVLCKILEGSDECPFGRKGIYFSNTGDFTWMALNERIGEIGLSLGALSSKIPRSISLEDAWRKWGFDGNRLLLETNHAAKSRTVPRLAFEIGWAPTKTSKDWDVGIEETFRAVLMKRESHK